MFYLNVSRFKKISAFSAFKTPKEGTFQTTLDIPNEAYFPMFHLLLKNIESFESSLYCFLNTDF